MESALSPRDIQTRIRAGESLESVASAAGVTADHIRDYAAPILRELEYQVHTARASQVRRRGEASAQRRLGDVVDATMTNLGIAAETVHWSSRRDERRRWTITVVWTQDSQEHAGEFAFDQRGRFSTAANDDARVLIGDIPRPTAPVAVDPDDEPTIDLDDELALVRAVQDDVPVTVSPEVPASKIVKLPEVAEYSETILTEVDGVYDIVPNPDSDMDTLYEMLSGFNEDSVRIYAGLTQPVAPDVEPETENKSVAEQIDDANPAYKPASESQLSADREASNQETPTAVSDEPVAENTEAEPESVPTETEPADRQSEQAEVKAEPAEKIKPAENTDPDRSPAEPTQDALVEQPAAAKPRKTTKKRKRASVPSWDEIMFGGPAGS